MANLRETINNHAPVMMIVAVLILVFALAMLIYQCDATTPGSRRAEQVWYYDLNTRELFKGPAAEIPPIQTASGPARLPDGTVTPAGVRAHVFGCGGCGDPAKRFIAYLETYTPAAKDEYVAWQMKVSGGKDIPAIYLNDKARTEGRFVRRPEDAAWTPYDSEQGAQVMFQYTKHCPPGVEAVPCPPPQN